MAKEQGTQAEQVQEPELDPEFAAALEAALALDASERLDRYSLLTEQLKDSLN